MFRSRFMPCQECGASVDRTGPPRHECLPERRADYQLFGMREEIAQLETGVRRFLATASGASRPGSPPVAIRPGAAGAWSYG